MSGCRGAGRGFGKEWAERKARFPAGVSKLGSACEESSARLIRSARGQSGSDWRGAWRDLGETEAPAGSHLPPGRLLEKLPGPALPPPRFFCRRRWRTCRSASNLLSYPRSGLQRRAQVSCTSLSLEFSSSLSLYLRLPFVGELKICPSVPAEAGLRVRWGTFQDSPRRLIGQLCSSKQMMHILKVSRFKLRLCSEWWELWGSASGPTGAGKAMPPSEGRPLPHAWRYLAQARISSQLTIALEPVTWSVGQNKISFTFLFLRKRGFALGT